MKIIVLPILFTLFVFGVLAQEPESPQIYQIQHIYRNADINLAAIKRFKSNNDWRSDRDKILNLFQPIKGRFKVIKFVSSHYGLSFTDKNDIFHDLLILKINQKNEILDALHYRLEWAEPPLHLMIFRSTKKGLKLKKGLEVSELEFKPFESGLEDWHPRGLLDNLYNLQEVF